MLESDGSAGRNAEVRRLRSPHQSIMDADDARRRHCSRILPVSAALAFRYKGCRSKEKAA
jgi:hypothetical protein